jgi:hypothetical protein
MNFRLVNDSGRFGKPLSSTLSDLKEIGCKSVWAVHISPLFRPIE